MVGGRDLNEQQAQDSTDVSKINAAGLINLRIQDAWNACTLSYNNGDFDGLRDELTALWPEFYADASKVQKLKIKKLDLNIRICLNNMFLARHNKKNFRRASGDYKKAIYRKWLFLKTLEKDQGVGKAYADPDADDWE